MTTADLPLVNRYLDTLESHLVNLAAPERGEVIAELRQHIADALTAGRTIDQVLESLGPVDALARAVAAMREHFAKSDKPLFVFIITSATHFPYDWRLSPDDDTEAGGEANSPEFNEYLRRLGDPTDFHLTADAILRDGFGDNLGRGARILDPDGHERRAHVGHRLEVRDRAERAGDESLNFLGSPRLLAFRRLARRSLRRRTRQHRILGSHPATSRTLEPARYFVGN
mgnify:CR=1 FL=1